MPDVLHHAYIIRALVAGLLIAVTMPVMGSFLVARRYSLIADSLSHVSLAGIGAALLLGSSPILLAIPVTACGAILLEWLRQKRGLSGEVGLAVVMSSGLALATVFASLAHTPDAEEFESYLFGSITSISQQGLLMLAAAALAILLLIFLNYRAFLHIAFDEDSARIAGYRVELLNYLMAALTAVIVVLSLRIVGGLLISALLVMPIVTASRFAKSFLQTILLAVIVAIVAVTAGLVIAFYSGVAAGGAIVLSAAVLLVAALITSK